MQKKETKYDKKATVKTAAINDCLLYEDQK